MVGHAWYPCFDPDRERWPSSLSKNVITQYLRNQLDYQGLVMTDDLDMGAILNEVTFEETIVHAINAGNDLAMICHRIDMVEEAVGYIATLDEPVIIRALENIGNAKSKMKPPTPFSLEAHVEVDEEIWDLRVAVLGEEKAKILSVEDGKRSPVELY